MCIRVQVKMSEKLALKWNDYQSNWSKSLSELRNDSDLADVTLISGDKKKFLAHKVILSSCSLLFKTILQDSRQQSSLLYLGGVSSVNLGFILDYIYHGEVKLYQEHLDSFLDSAQSLEIAGLLGDNQDKSSGYQSYYHFQNSPYEDSKQNRTKICKPEESTLVSTMSTGPLSRPLNRQTYNTISKLQKYNVGAMTPEL